MSVTQLMTTRSESKGMVLKIYITRDNKNLSPGTSYGGCNIIENYFEEIESFMKKIIVSPTEKTQDFWQNILSKWEDSLKLIYHITTHSSTIRKSKFSFKVNTNPSSVVADKC